MATVYSNPLLQGLSGKFGDAVVFKYMRGRTIATKPAARPTTQSVRQQQTRSKFREASQWAKTILLDPERKAYYLKKAKKLKLPNAYTAAITDYMRPVHIEPVHTSQTRKTFSADKTSFGVAKIHIKRFDAAGNEIAARITTDGFVTLTPDECRHHTLIVAEDDCGNLYEHMVLIPGS